MNIEQLQKKREHDEELKKVFYIPTEWFALEKMIEEFTFKCSTLSDTMYSVHLKRLHQVKELWSKSWEEQCLRANSSQKMNKCK